MSPISVWLNEPGRRSVGSVVLSKFAGLDAGAAGGQQGGGAGQREDEFLSRAVHDYCGSFVFL
jgi:hypothetical protein